MTFARLWQKLSSVLPAMLEVLRLTSSPAKSQNSPLPQLDPSSLQQAELRVMQLESSLPARPPSPQRKYRRKGRKSPLVKYRRKVKELRRLQAKINPPSPRQRN